DTETDVPKSDEDLAYHRLSEELLDRYGVRMPASVVSIFFNTGHINLVYTSRFFAGDLSHFDETFKFVGPPTYDRKERVDFPFEKLEGKKILYISLGTAFSDHSMRLYDVFFKSFADWDGVVVMTAYNIDQSTFVIPANFIVRNYVPQSEILRYATA